MNLQAIVKRIGPYRKREDEFDFKCPKCKDYKNRLTVNFKKRVYNCFNCGWSGTLLSLLSFLGITDFVSSPLPGTKEEADYWLGEYPKRIEIPAFYPLPKGPRTLMEAKAFAFLEKRGIKNWQLITFGVGLSKDLRYRGRVVIPIYEGGMVVCYTARAFLPDLEPKELFPPSSLSKKGNFLYGLDRISKGDSIILVEGIFDCEALVRYGYKSVAVMGSHLSRVQAGKVLAKYPKEIKILFDSDSAGEQGAKDAKVEILSRGYPGVVEIITLPDQRDPDELTELELKKILY